MKIVIKTIVTTTDDVLLHESTHLVRTDIPMSSPAKELGEVGPAKRKPGRPRTLPLPDPSLPKRKPGRPRKETTLETA
ncbi:hypothetical protein UFOVP1246_2 [uncultured Caudovirales phage]|jgi:hypothetical protein|uniref:Uncharacterized protein n=1 Tax=uncultured Caudovirales phage TaxID=2100421 RepID=A0A6J5R682_9CAUD|nr:hypothetical protein UFOVP1246_2 [uncultured Caudovirales phage]